MDMVNEAIRFANEAYGDTRRKDGREYLIFHAMEALAIVSTLTVEKEVLVATLLHDTVEDVGVKLDDLRSRFGDRVADIVEADTEKIPDGVPLEASWRMRKQQTIDVLKNTDDNGARILVLGDKLSNMRSFYRMKRRLGKEMWNGFHQRDPEKHHWYYRSIADLLVSLRDTEAWQEYDWLIKQVFEE